MNLSSLTAQHLTTTSGTLAIASTSTSLGVKKVISSAPSSGAEKMISDASTVLNVTEIIGICSVTILVLSFIWNVYSTKRRIKMAYDKSLLDEKYYILRKMEHELEIAKHRRFSNETK